MENAESRADGRAARACDATALDCRYCRHRRQRREYNGAYTAETVGAAHPWARAMSSGCCRPPWRRGCWPSGRQVHGCGPWSHPAHIEKRTRVGGGKATGCGPVACAQRSAPAGQAGGGAGGAARRGGRAHAHGRQDASRTSLMMMNGRPYSSNASDMPQAVPNAWRLKRQKRWPFGARRRRGHESERPASGVPPPKKL